MAKLSHYNLRQLRAINEIGHPKLIAKSEKQLYSPNVSARNEYAKFTTNKDHLDKLVNDKSPHVRCTVAQHQCIEHLDKLINDPDPSVREVVAEYGSHRHAAKLKNDEIPRVRNKAKWTACYYDDNPGFAHEWDLAHDKHPKEVQDYQNWGLFK